MLVLIVIIFIVLPLIVSVYSMISKKNIGCGIVALLSLISIVSICIMIDYSTSHISDSEVIARFEGSFGIDFPPSGKIIEKNYQEGFNFTGDSHLAFMIEVDTLTYNRALQEIQRRDPNVEFRKSLELQVAALFGTDTLDYKKIVRDNQYRYILDTLVSKNILTRTKANYIMVDDNSRFIDEEGSSYLLENRFPAEDCAHAHFSWWFHKNKRIIVYEYIDY